ncbi:AI-2E family transporter [Gordonia shandongensis]|uniref:AI-2E family transporter n=1 Tax=Gordonia shandongensis TaxID=376351 RepID=UPI0009FCD795|nr:AI-2E family transporter [Gordonia shandongensis]
MTSTPAGSGPSPEETAAAHVHPAVRIAAAWTWRLLILAVGVYVLGRVFFRFEAALVPVAVAILMSAFLAPVVGWLERRRVPRSVGVLASVLVTFAAVGAALTFVVRQLIVGIPNMAGDIAEAIAGVREWLETGPFKLDSDTLRETSDSAISWLQTHQDAIATSALDTASTVTKLLTAALLTIFLLIFFLYDGHRIWEYVTRIVPTAHRGHVRGAGEYGFRTLQSYVRATVLVALIDAVGVGIGLAILGVPMVMPLMAIIFLGAFIPIVGSVAAGSLAVFVALASHGWLTAVLVLVVLVVVMQVESHVLQPFLLGRSVRLHPVAVILAITAGILLAGIIGGLLAVPALAFANRALSYRSDVPAPERSPDEDPPAEQPPLREEAVDLRDGG